MSFDPSRHHRRSVRLPGYDYTWPGAYFITIVTQGRECLFGDVLNGEMRLSRMGEIVAREWVRTGDIRPSVRLDAFIVMPNHVHGIIMLQDAPVRDAPCGGTARRAPAPVDSRRYEHFGRPVAGSIPTIVRAFKSAVTNGINRWRGTPGAVVWQRGYYEHVVRDEESLDRIRQYIADNPAAWDVDPENPTVSGDTAHWVAGNGGGTARRPPAPGHNQPHQRRAPTADGTTRAGLEEPWRV